MDKDYLDRQFHWVVLELLELIYVVVMLGL